MRKVDSVSMFTKNMKLYARLYFKNDKNDETFNDFCFEDYSDENKFIEVVKEYLSLKNIEINEEELKNFKFLISICYSRLRGE